MHNGVKLFIPTLLT